MRLSSALHTCVEGLQTERHSFVEFRSVNDAAVVFILF